MVDLGEDDWGCGGGQVRDTLKRDYHTNAVCVYFY